MERASLPMPSKTAPFMTPCAVPQALSVKAHAIAKKIRLIITAPFFRSKLRTFEICKELCGANSKIVTRLFRGASGNGVLWVGEMNAVIWKSNETDCLNIFCITKRT